MKMGADWWHLIPTFFLAVGEFGNGDLPDWWKTAGKVKRFGAMAGGLIGMAVGVGLFFYGAVEVVQEFRGHPDELDQHAATIEEHAERLSGLEPRVRGLENAVEGLEARSDWMVPVLRELRCRARVRDGVYATYTECWRNTTPPNDD